MGLKGILQQVMPIATVHLFGSLAELEANNADSYYHYFVAMNLVLQNRAFFQERRRKTIVLTLSLDPGTQLSEFHSLCVNVPEKILVRNILMLEQHAHRNGKNLPAGAHTHNRLRHLSNTPLRGTGRATSEGRGEQPPLTNREVEVLTLIAQGLLNKEIAQRLNIGLATVITHRRNIMEKLHLKSVPALTIYAVMHGYVDINKI